MDSGLIYEPGNVLESFSTIEQTPHFIELRRSETPVFQAGDENVFLCWGLGRGGNLCRLTNLCIYDIPSVWIEQLF